MVQDFSHQQYCSFTCGTDASRDHVFGDTYFHNRAGVDFYLTYLHVAHMITYLHVPQHLGWGGDVTIRTTCTHGGCSATPGVGG